jgi:hypothetical protein
MILEEIQSLTRSRLFEAEDDEKADEKADEGGDEGEDDLFGGDEGGGEEDAADTGDDQGDDESGDDADTDADADKDEEESDDKEEEKEPEPTGPVGDEVDVALKDVMADFEKRALDAAAAKSKITTVDAVKKEGRRLSLARLLFEAEDDEVVIDVGTFAGDIARLIKNYDTLIDMEGVIYAKARDFLEKKYGSEYADQLDDILAREYDLEFDHTNDPEKAEQTVYAVGASGGGGAGA